MKRPRNLSTRLSIALISWLTLVPLIELHADTDWFDFSGHISDMQSVYVLQDPVPISPTEDFQWTNYNQLSNRLNFNLYGGPFHMEVGMRNRVLAGSILNDFPVYSTYFEEDNGLVDLSWNLVSKDYFLLNTSFDRLFIDFTAGNWLFSIGRQRVNWGMALVWTPNDLFNAFSYTDFDYTERPGSDAALVSYFPTGTSQVDLAYAIDRRGLDPDNTYQHTLALRYYFNRWDWDFQCLSGWFHDDLVVGGGFTGNIGMVSIRGEASFFFALPSRLEYSENSLTATISADYSFSNSLFLHFAFLYNSLGTTDTGESLPLFNPSSSAILSPKRLSVGKYELFAQVSYPVSPILSVDFSTMFNPADLSAYLAPSVNVSLSDDWSMLFIAQVLLGEEGTEYAASGNTYAMYVQVQWDF